MTNEEMSERTEDARIQAEIDRVRNALRSAGIVPRDEDIVHVWATTAEVAIRKCWAASQREAEIRLNSSWVRQTTRHRGRDRYTRTEARGRLAAYIEC